MSVQLTRFQIIGLKNYRNFNIHFEKPYKIAVGENGIGKTSLIHALYLCLTAKWSKLSTSVIFDFIEITFTSFSISFSKSELDMYVFILNNSEDNQFLSTKTQFETLRKFDPFDSYIKDNIRNRIVYLSILRNLPQELAALFGKEINSSRLAKLIGLDPDLINSLNTENSLYWPFLLDKISDQTNKRSSSNELMNFINVCNKYLEETKLQLSAFKLLEAINKNNNEEVDIENLSSGEKQILGIFSIFYLSNNKDMMLLIDEPELSLSIKWQKKLLPDIVASGNCSFLFAITHSPFIFKNDLATYAEGINLYING